MKRGFLTLILLFLICLMFISSIDASDLNISDTSNLYSDESTLYGVDLDENLAFESDEWSDSANGIVDEDSSSVSSSALDEDSSSVSSSALDEDSGSVSSSALDESISSVYSADSDENILSNSSEDMQDEMDSDNDAKLHFGYWSRSGVMNSINLTDLADHGVTDILLNYFAYRTYEKSDVEAFIARANEQGIKIHIWTQIFWESGIWTNPVKDGVPNQEFFDEKIAELVYIANTTGLYGINFDYMRYPGPPDFGGKPGDMAIDNPGGKEAISLFRSQAIAAIREVNPNLVLSSCVAPNYEHFEEWFGYNYDEMTSSLDLVIPMLYTGTFYKDAAWVNEYANWFVNNSKGAEIWAGFLGYVNDDVIYPVLTAELNLEFNAAFAANAKGAIVFRYGITDNINFTNLTVENEEVHSFKFLDYKIKAAFKELNLTDDYFYSEKFDEKFKNGINVNNLVINGNNHKIVCYGKSNALIINASDVTINDLIFENCSSTMIYIKEGSNVVLNNVHSINQLNPKFSWDNLIIIENYDSNNPTSSLILNNCTFPDKYSHDIINVKNDVIPKVNITNATIKGSIKMKLMYLPKLNLKLVKVKRSAKKLSISATLKKGKSPLKGKKITFVFKCKKYYGKTSSKGIAKIVIRKKVLKTLKAGRKITYRATYGKYTVKRTVRVLR